MKFDKPLQTDFGIALDNMTSNGDPLVDEGLGCPVESVQRSLLDIANCIDVNPLRIGRVCVPNIISKLFYMYGCRRESVPLVRSAIALILGEVDVGRTAASTTTSPLLKRLAA